MTTIIIIAVIAIVALIVLSSIINSGYVKAGPSEAIIITGSKQRILIGKSGLRMPILDRIDYLDLSAFSVDVKTPDFVATNDYINLKVDGVVKIQVSQDPELLKIAAKNYANVDREGMVASVQDVLEGNLREIIGQMKLTEIVQNRKMFGDNVTTNAVPDLKNLGLELLSFNVQSLEDANNVIDDLGIDNVVQIQKDAAISRAKSEKEIAIAKSSADQEANVARVDSAKKIAEQNSQLAIKEAELQKTANIEKAKAESAYQIEKETQRKQQEIVSGEANMEKSERDIAIGRNRIIAESNNKEDAELYAKQQEAMGLKAVADAEAEASERRAKAEAHNAKLKAEAEAESIAKLAKANAQRISDEGKAEATAILEKAKAMEEYGEAAKLEIILEALVNMSKNVSEPLNNIDSITMYGEGNQSKLIEDVTTSLSQVNNGLSDSLGLDIKSILANLGGASLLTPRVVVDDTPAEPVIKKPNDDANVTEE